MISIKKAEIEDLPFLEKVENECFEDAWSFSMLKEELMANNTTYSILLCENEPIGYYSYLHIFDEAHILNVAILPYFQGKGYANSMMKFLLEQTLAEGLPNVTLEVRRSNKRAISLYEKFGFKRVGVRLGYYMNGEDAVIYWLYR